jgi:CTP synthase
MPEQANVDQLGGTMRLGQYPCVLHETSRAFAAYQESLIHERHRHRFEVNNDYRDLLAGSGMLLSGTSPDNRIVEMIELPDHPWYVGCQFHPEFNRPTGRIRFCPFHPRSTRFQEAPFDILIVLART